MVIGRLYVRGTPGCQPGFETQPSDYVYRTDGISRAIRLRHSAGRFWDVGQSPGNYLMQTRIHRGTVTGTARIKVA